MLVAKVLGLSQFGQSNLYQSEKSLIDKYLFKMDDFNGDFRYLHDEIEERAQDSIDNQENLPELMCQIFAQCEKTIERNKQNFLNEIDEVINKQQASFSKDNEQKVPQFYQRLSQKYNQLQAATNNSDQMEPDELLEIL